MKTPKRQYLKVLAGSKQWFGDQHEAALVDVLTGRMLGGFAHDGHGKYDIWLYASPWRAWRLLREAPGWVVSWSPFPRCCVQLLRLKDVGQAIAEIEYFSGCDAAEAN